MKTISIVNLNEIENICLNSHNWKQFETDSHGTPIKYQCIDCRAIYKLNNNKRNNNNPNIYLNPNKYFDQKNEVNNRIKKNIQKISYITLKPLQLKDKIELGILKRENSKLKIILNLNK